MCLTVLLDAGAASTRVSNALGQGKPNAARTAITASLAVSTCTQIIVSLTIFLGRSVWGYVLSSDNVVVSRISAMLPFLALMVPCDGYNAIFSGKLTFLTPIALIGVEQARSLVASFARPESICEMWFRTTSQLYLHKLLSDQPYQAQHVFHTSEPYCKKSGCQLSASLAANDSCDVVA